MKRTTIYLPDELKTRLEQVAREEGVTEAEVIRQALDTALQAKRRPRPTIPLFADGLGDPNFAERADDLLEGFGD